MKFGPFNRWSFNDCSLFACLALPSKTIRSLVVALSLRMMRYKVGSMMRYKVGFNIFFFVDGDLFHYALYDLFLDNSVVLLLQAFSDG